MVDFTEMRSIPSCNCHLRVPPRLTTWSAVARQNGDQSARRLVVNFGCGPSALNGYLNVDGSFTVLLSWLPLPAALLGPKAFYVRRIRDNHIRYGTARNLRFPEASLDGFYASHVFEHLHREQARELLSRVRRWLKPTGYVRIVLPDLKLFARLYLEGRIDASGFIDRTGLARRNDLNWWQILFGHCEHRWMYDADSAMRLLESLGFRNITERECGESELEEFIPLDQVTDRAAESFYLEARPG
jgi:SAM-dependent methyltransferase